MFDSFFFQHTAQKFGHFYRDRSDKNRLTCSMSSLYFFNDSMIFFCFCFIYRIFKVFSLNRFVCRDFYNVHSVNITELFFFCKSRTCHTALLLKFIKQVLECDRRKRLALSAHFYVFLRLNRLMQPVRITSSRHDTSCKFIDDHNLSFCIHNIVLIFKHQIMRAQSKDNIMLDLQIFRIGKIFNMEEFLYFLNSVFCQVNCLFLFIDNKITRLFDILSHNRIHLGEFSACLATFKLTGKNITRFIKLCRFSALPGNNKRRSRLVDQNRVNLIDDRKIQTSLYELFFIYDHVVTQLVKSEFIIRYISNIAVICRTALFIVHSV